MLSNIAFVSLLKINESFANQSVDQDFPVLQHYESKSAQALHLMSVFPINACTSGPVFSENL